MPFQMHISPIFAEVIARHDVKLDPWKLKALTKMPIPNSKKELRAFFGITDYLNKFFPSTTDVCESQRQLTSSKTEWTWNATYQKLFDKAKPIIMEDVYIKFYEETMLLYLETDASGIRLRAALLQTRSGTSCQRDKAPDNSILRPIAFASKSLSNAERRYSNIEREALGILHRLKQFYHYHFVRDMSIIMGHKPLVTIFKKNVAMLSQRIQWILLRIHQYRVRIMSKPGWDLFIADWISRQKHKENKDEVINGMQLNTDTIQTNTNICKCMMIQQLQQAISQDDHLQQLKNYIIRD